MDNKVPFAEVLDVVEKLSMEEQQTLVDILHHRIREMHRDTMAAEIEKSRRELREGSCHPAAVDDIMKERQP